MKADVLLGLQWGDEGKGKIVDVLTPKYDVVARFQGGPNAGHSLEFNNIKHVLHSIPSGIFRENAINIIGNGVVIDPVIFAEEIDQINKMNVDLKDKLLISKKAHLILPSHRMLDAAYEKAKGKSKIGSTLKGIGPTYTDKISRNGMRVGDTLASNYKEKYEVQKQKHKDILERFSFKEDYSEYEQKWFEGVELLKTFQIIDSEYVINELLQNNKTVLAEGAQGTLLDIDFGSYPFVTSSNTVCAGACIGLGIAPSAGIFKSYCTRVGSGPFPTELNDSFGEQLQKNGNEFGATTGRPRRCGWLDLTALKYSVMINGVTKLIMTKADVLSGFDNIKVAMNYKVGNETIDRFPFDIQQLVEPNYKEFKGWQKDITNVQKFEDLPEELIQYVKFIEKEVKVPIWIVSVGPNRDQTIYNPNFKK